MRMRIVIPGGSGHVGRVLARAFARDGHEAAVICRHPTNSDWKTVYWDASTPGDWVAEFEGADAVINLAGRSVNCRYGPANRALIKNSRVETTRLVGQAIANSTRPPRLWIQASTATIYAHRFDAANDEATGIIGGQEQNVPDTWKFSIDAAKSWELEVDKAMVPNTRSVKFRSAMVMSPDRGGIFDTLLGLVRIGLGGTAGDGRQYVSWVHETDFVRAIYRIIERPELAGAVNVCAPSPLPNAEFMRVLRDAWGIRLGGSLHRDCYWGWELF